MIKGIKILISNSIKQKCTCKPGYPEVKQYTEGITHSTVMAWQIRIVITRYGVKLGATYNPLGVNQILEVNI